MTDAAFRRAALRLASLHHEDREWLLSHLPAEQMVRLQSCIMELQTRGFTDHADVMAEAAADGEAGLAVQQDDAVAALLVKLAKPAWKVLLLRSLPEPERRKWEEQLTAENPFVYRRLFSEAAFSRLPPAWADVLRQQAGRNPEN